MYQCAKSLIIPWMLCIKYFRSSLESHGPRTIQIWVHMTPEMTFFCRNAFHKESKTCIPQEHAFDVPSYVLKHTMNGQEWPQGDAAYHEAIDTLTLLIHGRDDHLVSVEEEQAMVEVRGTLVEKICLLQSPVFIRSWVKYLYMYLTI